MNVDDAERLRDDLVLAAVMRRILGEDLVHLGNGDRSLYNIDDRHVRLKLDITVAVVSERELDLLRRLLPR
jgi:hypothetical protein